MSVRIYDRHGFEVAEPRMIWVDRLAVAFFLLTGFLIGLVYLTWGAPGAFKTFEEITAVTTIALWFVGRVIDFAITGRIR